MQARVTATCIATEVLQKRQSAVAVCLQHVECIRAHDQKLLAFEQLDPASGDRAAAIGKSTSIEHQCYVVWLAGASNSQ